MTLNRRYVMAPEGGSAASAGAGGSAAGGTSGSGEAGSGGGQQASGAAGSHGGATGGAAGSNQPWYSSFSEENRGYAEAKGFKDPQAVVESYRNMEKHLGVPKERLLTIPDREDSPDWKGIYGRLGRPEKPEGYAIDMGHEEFTKWTQATFHEMGLSKKQGETIAKKWSERQQAAKTALEERQAQQSDSQIKELKKEWGTAFETKRQQITAFAKAVGISDDMFDSLEGALGVDGFAKLVDTTITKFGLRFGEAEFRTGDVSGAGFGPMSPAAAKSHKAQLLGDAEWVKRYVNGGVKEKQQMEHLERQIWEGRQIVENL